MLDRFRGQHLAQITSAGRITDHAGHLHPLHQAQRHEMTDMQAVCSRVKADIKGRLTVVD